MKAARRWIKLLLLSLPLVSPGRMVYAGGTIQFVNGPLTRMQWYPGPGGATGPVPTTAQIVYGVFWGTNRNELTMALPLGTNSTVTAGLIVAPNPYPIAGTEGGQMVYLQIKAWPAAYGTNWLAALNSFANFAETDIRQVTLDPEAGPGTVIWQSATGTNPNRFYPLTFGLPLTPPVFVTFGYQPNPSIVVDEGSQGVVDLFITVNRFANALPSPSNLNFSSTVVLSTANLTAVAGQDYVPTNILVTFAPGETVRQVAVRVTGDALPEPDEQFAVTLAPTSSAIAVLYAPLVVTIREARVVSVRRDVNQSVVTLRTTSSQRYALESSPDLTAWSAVAGADNIAGTGGNVEVTDPSEDCCGHRFYRARLPP